MAYTVQAGWDDVPHITPAEKQELRRSIPPYQIEARTKGLPMLGSGAIYPIAEEEIAVSPFEIPSHWTRGYALDVGWNWTAALWLAHDRDADTMYVTDVYKASREKPSTHVGAIKPRCDGWIPGVVDPAARQRSPKDGEQLLELYTTLGLDLTPANNAVEAGLQLVWDRFTTNRLKVFKHLQDFWQEFRIYRRDEHGKVVKVHDHIMDCLRYRVMESASMVSESEWRSYDGRAGGRIRYRGST